MYTIAKLLSLLYVKNIFLQYAVLRQLDFEFFYDLEMIFYGSFRMVRIRVKCKKAVASVQQVN